MSTASRYREAACGSRAGCRNAAAVPGETGKTRGHYDPRAERQIGSPGKWTGPKHGPEFVTATSGAGALAPDYPHMQREPRLRHSPPPFFPRPPPDRRCGKAACGLEAAMRAAHMSVAPIRRA